MKDRIAKLMKMPTVSPVIVRKDFKTIFRGREDLFEPAFFVYFEPSQSRVQYFLGTSQSGAANKIKQINKYLENLLAPLQAKDEEDLTDEECDLKELVIQYMDFFLDTRTRAKDFTYLYKANDSLRKNSMVWREPICEWELSPDF